MLPPNVAVDVIEQDAVYRRVRVRGTMLEYWTYATSARYAIRRAETAEPASP
jgi:hypothetical protein